MPSAIQIHDELVARYRDQRKALLDEEPGVDFCASPERRGAAPANLTVTSTPSSKRLPPTYDQTMYCWT